MVSVLSDLRIMQTNGSAPRTISRLRHLNWGIDKSVLSMIGASLSESQNVLNGSAACMLYVLCMYVCMYVFNFICKSLRRAWPAWFGLLDYIQK